MAEEHDDDDLTPPARLANLLETLKPAERQEIVTWLISGNEGRRLGGVGGGQVAALRRQVGGWLPVGEGTQLVTIRLPTDQHDRLRTWCTEHSFTMAAVVRGLVERFLDEQGAPASAQQ